MTIFGNRLADYLRFESGFLILILVVGLARLILSLLGAPDSAVKFLSLTVLFLLGMVYYSVMTDHEEKVQHAEGQGRHREIDGCDHLPMVLEEAQPLPPCLPARPGPS
jgi:hypothetical protein